MIAGITFQTLDIKNNFIHYNISKDADMWSNISASFVSPIEKGGGMGIKQGIEDVVKYHGKSNLFLQVILQTMKNRKTLETLI